MAVTWKGNVLQGCKTGSQVPTWNSAGFYQFSAINVTYISFDFSVKISWPNQLILENGNKTQPLEVLWIFSVDPGLAFH